MIHFFIHILTAYIPDLNKFALDYKHLYEFQLFFLNINFPY